MASIKEKGNQLVLVHGARDPEIKKIVQETLFTIYSKGEALKILGRGKNGDSRYFQSLIKEKFPHIKFNWEKINQDIETKLSILPDFYQYRQKRLTQGFRKDFVSFFRTLALTDPQWPSSSSLEVLKEHRHELEFMHELIEWRLQIIKSAMKEEDSKKIKETSTELKWPDDPFYWRSALRPHDWPGEVEEMAQNLYQQGDHDRARCIFKLLIDSFENYADGHNYLGLIALSELNYDLAIKEFRNTVEVGRKKFSKKIPKNSYWLDHDTRPYMRGLRNLALTLNRAGEFDEALEICARLKDECGDNYTASSLSSLTYLNLKLWKKALNKIISKPGDKVDKYSSFEVAFALFELGDIRNADIYFLYGALCLPISAHSLVDITWSKVRPKSFEEVEDHNTSIDLEHNLFMYLDNNRRPSLVHFRKFLKKENIKKLLRSENTTTTKDKFELAKQFVRHDS